MSAFHTILFDARMLTPEPTGVGRYVHSLLDSLIPLLAEDECLHVLVPSGIELRLPVSGNVVLHPIQAPFGTQRCRWQTIALACHLHPEVFHTPSVMASVHIPGRNIITLHSLLPVTHPHFCTFAHRLHWRFRAFHSILHARRLIAVSNDAFKACEKYFGKRILSHGEVIHPGLPSSFMPQPDEKVAKLRLKYKLPDKFFLYVGSDAAAKNLNTLFEAYSLLDSTTTIPMVLAGFAPEKSDTRHMAESLGIAERICWLGEVPEEDLPALYTAAHIFVFPSLDEGFCYPVLEAMACGTPVICSALNVLKEITDDTARIVHPTDRQEWKTAMHSSLVSIDWHDAARVKGLARAAEYGCGTAAEKTLAVYRGLYPKRKNYAQSM